MTTLSVMLPSKLHSPDERRTFEETAQVDWDNAAIIERPDYTQVVS